MLGRRGNGFAATDISQFNVGLMVVSGDSIYAMHIRGLWSFAVVYEETTYWLCLQPDDLLTKENSEAQIDIIILIVSLVVTLTRY